MNFILSGKEVVLEDLGAGKYFSELAAIDGRPRSSTVVALEDSGIAKLSPERFLTVMKMYPNVAMKVMANLVAVIRTSTEHVIDLTTLDANNRVHGELLKQAASSQTDDIPRRLSRYLCTVIWPAGRARYVRQWRGY